MKNIELLEEAALLISDLFIYLKCDGTGYRPREVAALIDRCPEVMRKLEEGLKEENSEIIQF